MILTRDEVVRLNSERLTAILRRSEKEVGSPLELVQQDDTGKTLVIAKALIKSVRPVTYQSFSRDKSLLEGHGFKSINGVKHHILTLYGQEFFARFQANKVTMYRYTIDYSLADEGRAELENVG